MSEMKRYKIVYEDHGINKVAKGYIEDIESELLKVTGRDGTIYISKKHIVFMREL